MTDPTPDTPETLDLLTRARGGDGTAFNRLFDSYRAYLVRLVQVRMDSRMRNRVDPSDVVQETQLEAIRRFQAYLDRPDVPFRLWLRQLAAERLNKLRRFHVHTARRATAREVRPRDDESFLRLAMELPGNVSTPSQQLSREELAGRVRDAVGKLDASDREVVVLRVFEGLSYEEVGYLLGIDPASARKRHSRAIVRLHRVLFNGSEDEP
jgi:RNA polymerase sigma-70 factor (ECF subfamily)